ncbi:MAG: hypothetical protein E7331_07105 [Clostridiales bacterium]|nr:hypothetical protein [Clostridiales bacterium]
MKKKILTLCAMVAVMLLLCSGAMAQEAVGCWVLDRAAMGSLVLNTSELDIEMTMTLSEDGTGKLYGNMEGEENEDVCTWSRSGDVITVVENGYSYDFILAGNELSGEVDGITLILVKQDSQPATIGNMSVNIGNSMAGFDGYWYSGRAYFDGQEFDLDELGTPMWFRLESGRGSMTVVVGEDDQVQANVTARMYEAFIAGSGGVKTVLELVNDDDASDVMKFVAQEEGTLHYYEETSGVTFVFERRPEE